MNFNVTKYPHGTFSWADCLSTDSSASAAFYSKLMSWEVEEIPMGEGLVYSMMKVNGRNVAAGSPMRPEMKAGGTPSFWQNYVTVDSVDTAAEKAKGLGAQLLMEPFDVFEDVRLAVVQDPTGATLGMWQPKKHIGAQLVNTTGALCWNELSTKGTDKAKRVLLVAIRVDHRTSGRRRFGVRDDYQWKTPQRWNDGNRSGMGRDAPPHWKPCFTVDSIDGAIEKAKSLGGQVHGDVITGDPGKFAAVADPTGSICMLIEASVLDPWEE